MLRKNMNNPEIVVISGNANKELANKICENLGISLADAVIGQFNDGETRIEIKENVRMHDV